MKESSTGSPTSPCGAPEAPPAACSCLSTAPESPSRRCSPTTPPPSCSRPRFFPLPSVASIATTYFLLRMLARDALAGAVESPADQIALTPPGRLALGGLIFASIVLLVASGLRVGLGKPTCAAALAALVVVSLKDRSIYKRAVLDISWSILP